MVPQTEFVAFLAKLGVREEMRDSLVAHRNECAKACSQGSAFPQPSPEQIQVLIIMDHVCAEYDEDSELWLEFAFLLDPDEESAKYHGFNPEIVA